MRKKKIEIFPKEEKKKQFTSRDSLVISDIQKYPLDSRAVRKAKASIAVQ
jgi:hypothetical protein